ncbi:MAG: DUF3108 domain-containing protein [Hyphomicrobiales bacterium]
MNSKLFTLICLFVLATTAPLLSQERIILPERENNAWQEGEKLTYRVFYESIVTGQVDAGEAITEVQKSDKEFEGRDTYHIVGTGKSKGAFNFFFKVRDSFESYVDKESLVPFLFVRRTREGSYKKDDDVYFNQYKHTAQSKKKLSKVPPNVHDFLSALFYARTYDIDSLAKNKGFYINFFLDDSTYHSWVKYEGVETILTNLGKFRCIKLAPMAATGKVFSEKYPMFIWVTHDKNHIPVLASSAVIVGNVKLELISYENIKNKMDAKLE